LMSPVTRTSLFWVLRARMRNLLPAAKYFVVWAGGLRGCEADVAAALCRREEERFEKV
jgi:hypothetical protein